MNLHSLETEVAGLVPMRFGKNSNLSLSLYGWEQKAGAATAQLLIQEHGSVGLGLPDACLSHAAARVTVVTNLAVQDPVRVSMYIQATLGLLAEKHVKSAEVVAVDLKKVFYPKVIGLKKATTVAGIRAALDLPSRMGGAS